MINKESLSTSAFYERYSVLADNRIMEILHNQKDFQEAAREAAIKIALERRLIYSADDLLAPEFSNVRSNKQDAFPSIADEYHRQRMSGSIFLFLSIFALLPAVYGALQYAKGDLFYAFSGIGLGALWFLLVFLMKRTQNAVFVYPLLFLLVSTGVFLGAKMLTVRPIQFMDIFILIVGVLLPAYFLWYARKLIVKK